MRGKGGIHLGVKKVFGKDYKITKPASSSNTPQDIETIKLAVREEVRVEVRKEVKENLASLLAEMGIQLPAQFDTSPVVETTNQEPPHNKLLNLPPPNTVVETVIPHRPPPLPDFEV